ncbi:MAG TPA: hypothetical protein VMJ65_02680 [Solirubrobacteraceae bacterium]|nr:hypothetical protein [Solirubrobacteraceae bacterium]
MAIIHCNQITTSTPEQFIAGLTDFGPGRSEVFGSSADSYLKVHDRGVDWADVTEGSRGIWERLDYCWLDPNRVVVATIDSNVWGGRSGHTYTFTRRPGGTTEIDYVVVREGKNVKGRALALLLNTVGRRSVRKAFANAVTAIEGRPDGGSQFRHADRREGIGEGTTSGRAS